MNGARFALPPLRERSDLDWLIQKLLEGSVGRDGDVVGGGARAAASASVAGESARAVATCCSYARAVCTDTHIEVDDLPENLSTVEPTQAAKPALPAASAPIDEFDPHLLPPEGMLLMQYLRAASWNLSAVARQIGVSRMTLYRRMARYGIRSPNQRDASDAERVVTHRVTPVSPAIHLPL